MSTLFRESRFGKPQLAAGVLLVIFLGECVWLIAHHRPSASAMDWQGPRIAGLSMASRASTEWLNSPLETYDREHSPLWYMLGSALVAVFHAPPESAAGMWLSR